MTLEITPIASILFSSSVTLEQSGSATCRGVNREYGFASGVSFILYSSPRLPNPWKT